MAPRKTLMPSSPASVRRRYVPRLEILEDRSLPSAVSLLGDVPDTLTHALDLGNLSVVQTAQVQEAVGNSAAGAADVDWYAFHLDAPALVTLDVHSLGSGFQGLLSLYSNDPDSPDPGVAIFHHRLIEQTEGGMTIQLAAGTFFVAVTGAGNPWFNPFLANSGSEGQTGAYRLDAAATPLDLGGLTLLGSDIPPDGVFPEAPLSLHLRLSDNLDLSTSDLEILQLDADGNPVDFVQFQQTYFSTDSKELQLVFNKGLGAGSYLLFAMGGENFDLLFDPITFTVASTEGGHQANDTAAAATDLGALASGAVLQHSGFIGNNPNYDNFGDPTMPGPGADLDIYHFTISGPGRYALLADLFANRIGSPLDAGLTLFQIVDGQAVLLAGNNNTRNGLQGDDFSQPLYTDAALITALGAGEYYIVVSAAENALDPLLGQNFGGDTYDPALGLTPLAGSTTGFYVLNLFLTPDDEQPPQVAAVSITPDQNFTEPLQTFTVEFSEPVNLHKLAYQAYQQQSAESTAAVFLVDSAGERVYPRMVSYDDATNIASFVMLERLPPGTWELHISGPGGITDLAGNTLQGNPQADGDFIVPFAISAVPPVNPLYREVTDPEDSFSNPQELGILFAAEVQDGITIARNLSGPTPDHTDYFRFTVLQSLDYTFSLGGDGLNVPGRPILLNILGDALTTNFDPNDPTNPTFHAFLQPGVHTIAVVWDPATVPQPVYELHIGIGAQQENPTPLTQGPAPVFRLQLVTNAPPPLAPSDPPPPRLPLPDLPVIVPASLISGGNGGAFNAPTGPAGAIAGLAPGPVGVVTGPAEQSLTAALRLTLPSFQWVSKESATREKAGAQEDVGMMQSLDGLWRELLNRLLQGLQQFSKPLTQALSRNVPEDTTPSEIAPSLEPGLEGAEDPTASVAPAPPVASSAAWSGVIFAITGLALVDDRNKNKARIGLGRRTPKHALPA